MFSSVAACALLGLEISPNMSEAYLIAYGKENPVCQLQPSYIGLIKLALKHPDIKGISVRVVRANDEFLFKDGIDRVLTHKFNPFDTDEKRGEIIGVHASYETHAGYFDFETMNMEQIAAVRSVSKGGDIWRKWFEEMAKKSVLRRLCKRIPKTLELTQAINYDIDLERGKAQDHSGHINIDITDGPEPKQPVIAEGDPSLSDPDLYPENQA